MSLETRKVSIVGATPTPNEVFLNQAALDLDGFDDGILSRRPCLIADRDQEYPLAILEILKERGVKVVRISASSPNRTSHAEWFVRSAKAECCERMMYFGERSLRRAVAEYGAQYHVEWNH